MQAKCVGMATMVGYPTEIGVKGNCFSVYIGEGDGPKTRDEFLAIPHSEWVGVANIGLESLKATGVPFPIEGEMREKLFYVTDERIPKEAYRTGKLCFCMGGENS